MEGGSYSIPNSVGILEILVIGGEGNLVHSGTLGNAGPMRLQRNILLDGQRSPAGDKPTSTIRRWKPQTEFQESFKTSTSLRPRQGIF
jgi:hypothetical protein